MAIAQKERDTREGTYKSGIGMDGGYTEEDLDNSGGRRRKGGKKKTAKEKCDKVCPFCGKEGHVRRSSKHCDNHVYPKNRRPRPTSEQATANNDDNQETLAGDALGSAAADDVDALDAMPLDDSSGSKDFFDARDAITDSSSDSDSC